MRAVFQYAADDVQIAAEIEWRNSIIFCTIYSCCKKQKLLHTDIFLNASTLVNLNLLRYNFVLVYDNSNR